MMKMKMKMMVMMKHWSQLAQEGPIGHRNEEDDEDEDDKQSLNIVAVSAGGAHAAALHKPRQAPGPAAGSWSRAYGGEGKGGGAWTPRTA